MFVLRKFGAPESELDATPELDAAVADVEGLIYVVTKDKVEWSRPLPSESAVPAVVELADERLAPEVAPVLAPIAVPVVVVLLDIPELGAVVPAAWPKV